MEFLRVPHLPSAGDIVHASDAWSEPGGGGSVAVVQLAKLARGASFFTALGDDELGHRSASELSAMGVSVRAVFRPEPQRRGVTFIDDAGERTITVFGERMGPHAADPLPWDDLAEADAVYLTAADVEAVRRARRARVLVATSRVVPLLAQAGVELDALVGSAADPAERYEPGQIVPEPRLLARTAGAAGGIYAVRGEAARAFEPAPLPGPVVDTYGAGDSFAAGLTFGLGAGMTVTDAIALAARCGAAVVTGRGPYPGQLTAADL
jgi:ribokinase